MNKALKNTRKTNKFIALFLILLLLGTLFCACDNQQPAVTPPVSEFDNGFFGMLQNKKLYITSIGQATDSGLIARSARDYGIDFTLDISLDESASPVPSGSVVFLVIGCSAKSMSERGVNAVSEIDRATAFLDRADLGEITVVAWHVGGTARRGLLSDRMVEQVFTRANYVCFTAEGNADFKLSTWADHDSAIQCQLANEEAVSTMIKFMAGVSND